MDWLVNLKKLVEARPMVLLRLDSFHWEHLQDTRRGTNEFTIAKPHWVLEAVRTPTLCIASGTTDNGEFLHLGLIRSRGAITTLDTRIKIVRSSRIRPDTESDLVGLVTDSRHANNLRDRVSSSATVVSLSPKLSCCLVDELSKIPANRGVLRLASDALAAPKRYSGPAAMQDDAVHTALKAFGLTNDDAANSIELISGQASAISKMPVMEDRVVEHDARSVPGYTLAGSDLTGRAVFERHQERLEVFTANRGPLETVFGVDLIYLNLSRSNIVMLQYKMLESSNDDEDGPNDWIYRPDAKFWDEVSRMKHFVTESKPELDEYRLNQSVFYLKFIKRNGFLKNGSIVIPLEHFERLREDPMCRGPRGGLRVSYESLSGRYLRQSAFLDLVRAGYVGAYAETTAQLQVLVEAVLRDGKSVVAAIQRPLNLRDPKGGGEGPDQLDPHLDLVEPDNHWI